MGLLEFAEVYSCILNSGLVDYQGIIKGCARSSVVSFRLRAAHFRLVVLFIGFVVYNLLCRKVST